MQGFCHLVASTVSNYCTYHIITTFSLFLLEAFGSREQNREHIVSLALKLLSLVSCSFISELHSVALKMMRVSIEAFPLVQIVIVYFPSSVLQLPQILCCLILKWISCCMVSQSPAHIQYLQNGNIFEVLAHSLKLFKSRKSQK